MLAKRIILTMALLMFCTAGYGQTKVNENVVTWNLAQDLDQLLPAGRTKFYYVGYQFHPLLVQLTEKLKRAALNEDAWYLDFRKRVAENPDVDYDPSWDFTEEEFELVKNPDDGVEKIIVDSSFVEIWRDDSTYTFHAEGYASQLNTVRLDFKQRLVLTDFGEIPYDSIVDITRDNPTGIWKGHSFHYEAGDSVLTDISTYNSTVYKFKIGQLAEDHRAIMFYTCYDIINGQKEIRADLVITYDLFK